MTKVPQPKRLGDFLCVYIILGLQIVNLFCILVTWKNVTTYNYSNEYGLGFAKCQPFSYIEDIS